MNKKKPLLILPLICLMIFACRTKQNGLKIKLDDQGLNPGIIWLTLPDDIPVTISEWELHIPETGNSLPVQRVNDSQAVFILKERILKDEGGS